MGSDKNWIGHYNKEWPRMINGVVDNVGWVGGESTKSTKQKRIWWIRNIEIMQIKFLYTLRSVVTESYAFCYKSQLIDFIINTLVKQYYKLPTIYHTLSPMVNNTIRYRLSSPCPPLPHSIKFYSHFSPRLSPCAYFPIPANSGFLYT